MTVVLGYDPSVGFCLFDVAGNYVSAIWFGTEEEAIDYCDEQGWTLFNFNPAFDED